jgi:16S rRNA processing protein RimM
MRRVTLGRIAGVFGVQGWLKVRSYSDPQANLLRYRRWFLKGTPEREVRVLEGRNHGQMLVVQLSEPGGAPITDRDLAARFVGAEIEVPREELPKLKRGEYYWIDLVGLEVRTASDEVLGKVESVTDNGAQAVLVLGGERQRLIPFVHGAVIQSVDLKAGRIVADWSADW